MPAASGPSRLPSRPAPPAEVVALAEARAAARAHRDWPVADALKAEIEAAGWKVEDFGRAWTLVPAVPPDVVVDGVTRYGSAGSVPSVLEEAPSAVATVVVVAAAEVEPFARLLGSLAAHLPEGAEVVVVGDDPDPSWDAPLAAAGAAREGRAHVEVIRTSEPLGAAAAVNAGMRRARGAVAILASTEAELSGDAVTPVVEALGDPSVAVAGAIGLAGPALPHLEETDAAAPDAIAGAWLGFRRSDHVRFGPLDERFVEPRFLDAWWSLVLRAGDTPGAAPRRAVRVDVPLVRHPVATGAPALGGAADGTGMPSPPVDARRERLARRNGYRLLDRFRDRPDLLAARAPAAVTRG